MDVKPEGRGAPFAPPDEQHMEVDLTAYDAERENMHLRVCVCVCVPVLMHFVCSDFHMGANNRRSCGDGNL